MCRDVHMSKKHLRGLSLSLLAGLEALHKQEVKDKAELKTAYWSVEVMTEHTQRAPWQWLGTLCLIIS